jgi:hypothetical protein
LDKVHYGLLNDQDGPFGGLIRRKFRQGNRNKTVQF